VTAIASPSAVGICIEVVADDRRRSASYDATHGMRANPLATADEAASVHTAEARDLDVAELVQAEEIEAAVAADHA
jgi:hypothetical protein